MEKLNVKDVVMANRKNTEAFGVFMSEHIHAHKPGCSLRQYLADEFSKGRVPLRGRGSNYDAIKERVIVTVPREWGADTPDELVGASVRFNMIGTIPISDDPDDGKITVVRLTEPTAGSTPDVVFDDSWVVENAALFGIGEHVWVRLAPPPMAELDDYEEEDDADDDNDGEDSYF